MANLLKNKISQQLQQVRHLPRWVQRQANRVIESDNYDSFSDRIRPQNRHDVIQNILPTSSASMPNEDISNKAQVSTTINKTKKKLADVLKTTFDSDGNFIYTKMGNNDIRISKIMAAVKSKNVKEKKRVMLLEGKTLIKEALQSGCKLEYILFSRVKEVR